MRIEGSASARRLRAEERRKRAVIRFVSLGAGEPDFLVVQGSEAISLVTRLTRESWSLGGRDWPRYARAATPYRFVPNRRQ